MATTTPSGNTNDTSKVTVPEYLSTYSATIASSSSSRPVQSIVTTRIIQVLLVIMAFCAMIAFLNQSTSRVLPKNPCSIAAVASLLAGSDLLNKNNFPAGSAFRDDKYLQNHVFNRWVFSMGWWERKNGTPRFAIDVGQYDAKDLGDPREFYNGT